MNESPTSYASMPLATNKEVVLVSEWKIETWQLFNNALIFTKESHLHTVDKKPDSRVNAHLFTINSRKVWYLLTFQQRLLYIIDFMDEVPSLVMDHICAHKQCRRYIAKGLSCRKIIKISHCFIFQNNAPEVVMSTNVPNEVSFQLFSVCLQP